LNDLANDSGGDKECADAVRECTRSVFGNADEPGINNLISDIAAKCSSDKAEIRRESCWMFQALVEERKLWIVMRKKRPSRSE
jgi:hypothetical protein